MADKGARDRRGGEAAWRELADSVRSLPPSLFGYVLVSVWQVWLNVADIPTRGVAAPISDSLTFLVTLLAIVALGALRPRASLRPNGLLFASCLGAAAAVGLAFGGNAVLVSACLLVSGAVKAVVNVGWGVLYARLNMRRAFVCVLLTYMVDRVLNGVMFLLPADVQALVAPACLVVGGALFRRAARRLGASPAEAGAANAGAGAGAGARRHTVGALCKFAVCLFAFNLAVVALLRVAPQTHGVAEETLMHAAEILLAGALLLAGSFLRRPVRFALLWGCAFVMITSSLLSVCLGLEALTLTLTKMSTGFLSIVIWLVAVDFAHHSEMSPAAVLAALRAASSLPSVALLLLQPLLPAVWNGPAVAATLMWLLSIATLYFMTERELIALRLFEGVDAVAPVQPGVADIERRCAEVGERFGLTERERQIMAMTCLGKSKAYIAAQIGVSESTVKSHVRNMYAKLDVHSKNELQELVGL